MISKELDNLVEAGVLKKEPADQREFDGFLDSAVKRLTDAKKEGLSAESKFDLAYSAAHALALAAMRSSGYRPNNQRYAVFQSLQHTAGMKAEIWRIFDNAHRLRNLAEYTGSFRADAQLLTDLIKATDVLLSSVRKLRPVK